jgi:hypothetical protein
MMQVLRVSSTVEGGTTGASASLRVDGVSVGAAVLTSSRSGVGLKTPRNTGDEQRRRYYLSEAGRNEG